MKTKEGSEDGVEELELSVVKTYGRMVSIVKLPSVRLLSGKCIGTVPIL